MKEAISIASHTRKNRTKIFSLFVLLLVVLFPLLFSEAGYRVYIHLAKPLMKPSGIENLGWEFTPGAYRRFKARDGRQIEYSINKKGFRDHTTGLWEAWRKEDYKILFIGDSVTEGAEVNYEEAYPAQVEKNFHAKGKFVRTVNFGMAATNTPQHLTMLKARGFGLGPDRVILGYFLNDTEKRSAEKIPPFLEKIGRHFYFAHFLAYKLSSWRQNKSIHHPDNPESLKAQTLDYERRLMASYESGHKDWLATAQIILEMKKLCLEREIDFGVVIFPLSEQISGVLESNPQKTITEFLSRERIPFLDMLEVFKAETAKSPASFYEANDSFHPNARGHEVAGQAIAQWMEIPPVYN